MTGSAFVLDTSKKKEFLPQGHSEPLRKEISRRLSTYLWPERLPQLSLPSWWDSPPSVSPHHHLQLDIGPGRTVIPARDVGLCTSSEVRHLPHPTPPPFDSPCIPGCTLSWSCTAGDGVNKLVQTTLSLQTSFFPAGRMGIILLCGGHNSSRT